MKLVALLLMIPFLAACASVPGGDDALGLGGLRLGQSESSVVAALGTPTRRTEAEADYLPVVLEFEGLVVRLDEQGLGGAESMSSRYCTPAGACPGMSYEHLRRLYGKNLVEHTGVPGAVAYVHGDGCWLEFKRSAAVVMSIELACSP